MSEPQSSDVSPPPPEPPVDPPRAVERPSAAEMPPDTSWIGFDLIVRDRVFDLETRTDE
jgi:hypothetical protein